MISDAGFRVGTNTPYRYVIIHIQYFSSVINDIYGQQITLSRQRYEQYLMRNRWLSFTFY
jgi:hypothetical protein